MPQAGPLVYSIRSKKDGRAYIGATTTSLEHRQGQHVSALKGGKHVNRHLQEAWIDEGEEGFEFSVIELVENADDLTAREQHHLDLHANQPLLNICRVAESRLGVKATEDTCRRIGAAKRGNKNRLGKPFTEESKKKISESLTGRKASAETRAKLSAFQKNRTRTPESAMKIGAAHRGKVIPQEMRDRISAKLKGRKITDAERQNRRLAMLAQKALQLNNSSGL